MENGEPKKPRRTRSKSFPGCVMVPVSEMIFKKLAEPFQTTLLDQLGMKPIVMNRLYIKQEKLAYVGREIEKIICSTTGQFGE